jgi:acyl CoA:acetate/3-ketoacid CoA transferase alpha subunit
MRQQGRWGWMETGQIVNEDSQQEIEIHRGLNGALAYRLLGGSLGVPFLPMRWVGGTDVFSQSGAKLVKDPYTGKPVVLVPSLNPDVALIHAHECDV